MYTLLISLLLFTVQSDPIKIEQIASFPVDKGYNYNLIYISSNRILYQEYITRDIISSSFDGSIADTLNIPIGRGPGERSSNSSPIKANDENLFLLDRSSTKVLKFSLNDLQFIHETLTPPGTWNFTVNDRVFVRSMMTEKFYHKLNFEDISFTPLSGADWTEDNSRLHNTHSFEAIDIATETHLLMVKTYDPVYYIYDLTKNELRLIRFENNPLIDFRNDTFRDNLKLHVQNAALFDDGRLLGIHGFGMGSDGRTYHKNTIHFFEPLTGEHVGQITIPDVEIDSRRMVSNNQYLALLDSISNQIHVYRYYLND
ncbi:MAG: hypothetical protein LAT57_14385 [Balneolales bacterium]|nr:hypothetical protein [Balneolales bacterium]